MNRKTERALETLALLYMRLEQFNSDFAKVDKEFDKEFSRMPDEMDKVKEAQRFVEITAQTVHESRETWHRLASDFDETEEALDGELGCIHKLIEEVPRRQARCRLAQKTRTGTSSTF